MPVTMDDVRKVLDSEEPDYGEGAMLGPDALPHLQELVQNSGDSLLASKATFLATVIPHEGALEVLKSAVARKEAEVRVAAASGAKNLMGVAADAIQPDAREAFQQRAGQLLMSMLDDSDAGVRKAAERSVKSDISPEAVIALRGLSRTAPESVRAILNSSLKQEPHSPDG